jgi:hypothetical protein
MDWTTVDFSGITDEIVAMLPTLVPVVIGLLGLSLAIRYVPKIAKRFTA